MDDALRERIEALERTVADGDFDGSDDALGERLSTLESRLETVESQLDDVEAATQALRGYVGNVRAVNNEVEQRADTAIAKVQALEDELKKLNASQPGSSPPKTETAQSATQTTRSGADADRYRETTAEPTAQRCQSCGQVHDNRHTETDGGSSHERDHTGGEEPLVPDKPDETGRLRRIRDLL